MRHFLFAILCMGALQLPSLDAHACGGCFSPPSPQVDQTVRQDAERVLFVRDPVTKQSTVWVEVRYTGLAKDFGWVLPVPKLPKVGVGSVTVFDAFDQTMQARIAVSYGATENCRNESIGCASFDYPDYGQWGYADASAAYDATSDSDSDGGNAHVEILSSGQTGPYNYVVVKGSDATVLFKWLNDNGYAMPDKAKPILQTHVDKGDLFVAVKLQNGQGVQAIRPIALTMDDAEPCVPLRLTSIAAVDDMSVIVTVAGPGRAIVKNHLDVTVNPLRLALANSYSYGSYGVPSNYQQVVAAAIDEASGHAFVTEYAQPGASAVLQSPYQYFTWQALAEAKTLYALAQLLAQGVLPVNVEVADALEPKLQLAAQFPGVTPLQSLANLRACAQFWGGGMGGFGSCNLQNLSWTQDQLQAIAIDGVALADDVTSTLVAPIADVQKQLTASTTVTRLVMRVSPTEMDRDPVFAFNASLPNVDPQFQVTLNDVCVDGWYSGTRGERLTIASLGSWVIDPNQGVDPRFKTLPAAWKVQVLDETGGAKDIDPPQAPVVAAAILGAKPGTPSLPADLVLNAPKPWTVPASDPTVTKVGVWHKPQYCIPKAGWKDGELPGPDVEPADAGVTDSNGTIPGVDAAGGWNDAGPLQDTAGAPTDTSSTKSGCTAGHAANSAWLALAFAVGFILRRRVNPRGN